MPPPERKPAVHDAWPETVNGWELAAEPGTSGVPEAELTFTLTDPVPDVSEARSAPDTGIERGEELDRRRGTTVVSGRRGPARRALVCSPARLTWQAHRSRRWFIDGARVRE